jgi:hypothetical protein
MPHGDDIGDNYLSSFSVNLPFSKTA